MRRILMLAGCTLALASCGDDGISVYDAPKEGPVAAPVERPRAHGPAPAPASGGLAWTVPAGWKAAGASGMRVETFGLPGGVELSVVTFPGDSGGLLANVNRWRGQLNQPAYDEAALAAATSRVAGTAGEVVVVEFPARDGTTALLGGILAFRGATWFFKATGPAAAVGAAGPAIRTFLGSLRPRGS